MMRLSKLSTFLTFAALFGFTQVAHAETLLQLRPKVLDLTSGAPIPLESTNLDRPYAVNVEALADQKFELGIGHANCDSVVAVEDSRSRSLISVGLYTVEVRTGSLICGASESLLGSYELTRLVGDRDSEFKLGLAFNHNKSGAIVGNSKGAAVIGLIQTTAIKDHDILPDPISLPPLEIPSDDLGQPLPVSELPANPASSGVISTSQETGSADTLANKSVLSSNSVRSDLAAEVVKQIQKKRRHGRSLKRITHSSRINRKLRKHLARRAARAHTTFATQAAALRVDNGEERPLGGGGTLAESCADEPVPPAFTCTLTNPAGSSEFDATTNTYYIDLAIVYTDEAKMKACELHAGTNCGSYTLASPSHLAQDVAAALSKANAALDNSALSLTVVGVAASVKPRLRLTTFKEAVENEVEQPTTPPNAVLTQDLNSILDFLQVNDDGTGFEDGPFDWITGSGGLRETYSADLVMVIARGDASPTLDGVSTQNKFNNSSLAAFSVVKAAALFSAEQNSVMIHEIGHLLGADHTDCGGHTALDTYSGSNGSDVMALMPANRTDLRFPGDGVAAHGNTDSDLKATLQKTIPCVAKYTRRSSTTRYVMKDPVMYASFSDLPDEQKRLCVEDTSSSNYWEDDFPCTAMGVDGNDAPTCLTHSATGCVQSMVNAVRDFPNDIIQVMPGHYYAHLYLADIKNLTLLGNWYSPEDTIIDASRYWTDGAPSPAVRYRYWQRLAIYTGISTPLSSAYETDSDPSHAWPTQTVKGFTIKNGYGASAATGVWCIGGVKLNLQYNIISNNVSRFGRGAGVGYESCQGTISNNIIRDNAIEGLIGTPDYSLYPNIYYADRICHHTDPSYDYYCGTDAGTTDTWGGTSWIRPDAVNNDRLGTDPAGWPIARYDQKSYQKLPGNLTYGTVGGAGIYISTSRYYNQHFPASLAKSVVIQNNIITSNYVPTNMAEFTNRWQDGATVDSAPQGVGAGVLLYGIPAKMVNNTIALNSCHNSCTVTPPNAARAGDQSCVPCTTDSAAGTTANTTVHVFQDRDFGNYTPGEGTILPGADVFYDLPGSGVTPPTKPMRGMGLACAAMGLGAEKPVLVNNIIARNFAKLQGSGATQATEFSNNVDCTVLNPTDTQNNLTKGGVVSGTANRDIGANKIFAYQELNLTEPPLAPVGNVWNATISNFTPAKLTSGIEPTCSIGNINSCMSPRDSAMQTAAVGRPYSIPTTDIYSISPFDDCTSTPISGVTKDIGAVEAAANSRSCGGNGGGDIHPPRFGG